MDFGILNLEAFLDAYPEFNPEITNDSTKNIELTTKNIELNNDLEIDNSDHDIDAIDSTN